jgi:hypothetical protein
MFYLLSIVTNIIVLSLDRVDVTEDEKKTEQTIN